jgi:hypothetical protein
MIAKGAGVGKHLLRARTAYMGRNLADWRPSRGKRWRRFMR